MKFPHVVVRVRAVLVAGPYNTQARDWDTAARAEMRGNAQPGPSSEDVVRQQRTETFVRFFLAPGSDVITTDRLEWDGDTYEVDGDVQVWTRGSRGHVLAVGKKITQG